jgi:hypothetical protein
MSVRTALPAGVLGSVEARLAPTDRLLATAYPGDDGSRQPVHTVYVPGDRYTPELPARWGREALDAVAAAGGLDALAVDVGIEARTAAEVVPLVERKLAREPIEDLRIDFEDGYGDRGDDVEDADAVRAAERVAATVGAPGAPPFIGIRFKSFEAATRARGIRTLDLFVTTLVEHGGLPDGLALTLPKVSTVAQVEAMAEVVAALERAHGLPEGRLRFEVQVETPQLVLGADGVVPVARLAHAAPGRIAGLHYGTYDYSAALGIAAPDQSLAHPAADHAKLVMQVAVAGTGIRLSDGSTNVLPVGDRARGRGGCTAGSCAARSSAASPRAGTCTRRSCRPGSSRRTRTTARATPRSRPACATCTTARAAACSTNPRRCARSPGSSAEACSAGRSSPTRSPPTPASTTRRSPSGRARGERRAERMPRCARSTDEEVP